MNGLQQRLRAAGSPRGTRGRRKRRS